MAVSNQYDLEAMVNMPTVLALFAGALTSVGVQRYKAQVAIELDETKTAAEREIARIAKQTLSAMLAAQGVQLTDRPLPVDPIGAKSGLIRLATLVLSSQYWTWSFDDLKTGLAGGTAGATVAAALDSYIGAMVAAPGA